MHCDYDAGLAQNSEVRRFWRERYGFFDPDLSAFCIAVSNDAKMDGEQVVLVCANFLSNSYESCNSFTPIAKLSRNRE